MKNILEKAKKCVQIIFGLIGITMILIQSYAVLARNVLLVNASWTDEVIKLLFVWSIFVCSSLAFYNDELIGLSLVEEKFIDKSKIYGTIKILQLLCALVLYIIISIQGISIVETQLSTLEVTPVVQIPLWVSSLGFLVGAIFTVIFAIIKIYDSKKYFLTEASK